jgi:type II secretory pathway pseudopilin PulG
MMQNPNLSFAKIVATPNIQSWSQVYNAGSLFAVLSLFTEEPSDEQPLTKVGKQIINNLEAEFFTLETKNLASIKNAVSASLAELPETITISVALSYVKENTLYVVLYGPGKISLRRDNAVGTLLLDQSDKKTLKSASGFLANDDILLLQTKQFADIVSDTMISESLELSLPSDIAETLTPHVHKSEDGGASAIIIAFKGVPTVSPAAAHTEKTEEDAEDENDAQDDLVITPGKRLDEEHHTEKKPFAVFTQKAKTEIHFPRLLKRKRLVALIVIALILAGVLLTGVFATMQDREKQERQAVFERVYKAAEQEYKDGEGLVTINPTYARDDLTTAKKLVEDALPAFPKGSEEEEQLSVLLQKINAALEKTSGIKSVNPVDADLDESSVLAGLVTADALSAAVDDDKVYALTKDAVFSVPQSGEPKSIIKNDNDWTAPAGFAAYNGNLYVLDKKDGVLKFVAGSGGYGKSAYFSGEKPSMTNAVSMTIDGSIWILFSDGTISKYTKGTSDTFTVKGLDTPLKNPRQIVTNADASNIYILDAGNARIVAIAKDGTFKAQYHSPVLQSAQAIDVQENAKKIYFLQDKKLRSIPMQ